MAIFSASNPKLRDDTECLLFDSILKHLFRQQSLFVLADDTLWTFNKKKEMKRVRTRLLSNHSVVRNTPCENWCLMLSSVFPQKSLRLSTRSLTNIHFFLQVDILLSRPHLLAASLRANAMLSEKHRSLELEGACAMKSLSQILFPQ